MTGEPVSAGQSTGSRRTERARRCVAATPWSERATLSRHPLTGGGAALRTVRGTEGSLTHERREAPFERPRNRMPAVPAPRAAPSREDTTGRTATEKRGSSDASFVSAGNRGCHACSQNAPCPDDSAAPRPASGQNPRDSGDITRKRRSLERQRAVARRRAKRGASGWRTASSRVKRARARQSAALPASPASREPQAARRRSRLKPCE